MYVQCDIVLFFSENNIHTLQLPETGSNLLQGSNVGKCLQSKAQQSKAGNRLSPPNTTNTEKQHVHLTNYYGLRSPAGTTAENIFFLSGGHQILSGDHQITMYWPPDSCGHQMATR